MSKKLIIFGAGGFSKSIIDSLNHKHYELIGLSINIKVVIINHIQY